MKIIFLGIFWSTVAYIFGSIPWGLVIGKVFYHKDIRHYGSHNLGGSNAGRVLGKKVGIIVILLDAFKALLFMLFCHRFAPEVTAIAGLFVAVGHCFPIFAQFRGGKAVACAFGYLLALGLLSYADFYFVFMYPVLIFFLIIGLTKIVSISSIGALFSAWIISIFVHERSISLSLFILLVLVIYRHIPNLLRIWKGEENKITWLR